MRKTYSQYIQYIKSMLGITNDTLDELEFDNEALTDYVKIAFSEILPYINIRKRITLPWQNGLQGGAIKLSDFDIRAKSVTTVRRGSSQGYLNEYGKTLYGTWYGTYYMPYSGLLPNFDPWSVEKLMNKTLNETAEDKAYVFDYDSQSLYLYFNARLPTSVTIDYIPEFLTAEDVDDDYWIMLIQKKALATTKLALSQYRGKFSSVTGAPFALDYQRLQTEGTELNREIQEILDENILNYRFS